MKKLHEGWEVVNLEDVATKMRSGGTPKSTNEEYYKGDIPFVKIDDITSCNKFLLDTKTKISKEALNNSSAWLVPEGAILYSMYASLGFLAINKIPVATNQAIMNIIPDTTTIDMEYLYQFLLDIKNKINKFVDQTTQKNLNAQKVRKFKIPLPPLSEQKKIAEILSTVDQKITFVDNQIEETELLKKGLMQKLLTEGIGHTEFKDSELGRIPVEWEVYNFGKYMDVKSGYGFKAAEYSDTGTPLVKIDNVSYEKIIWENRTYLPDSYIESYPELVLHEHDILLALNRPLTNNKLKMAMIKKSDSPSILYQRVGKILFDNKIYDRNFTFHILYKHVYTFVEQHSVGSDQPFINITKLRKMPIPLPPLEEQKQIAKILSTTDEKLENLKAKKESFEELKKGLMQKLLTGEVRV